MEYLQVHLFVSGLFGYVIGVLLVYRCQRHVAAESLRPSKLQSLPTNSLSQDYTNLDDHISQTSNSQCYLELMYISNNLQCSNRITFYM